MGDRGYDVVGGLGAGVDLVLESTLPEGVYYILVNGYGADDVNSYTLSLTAPLSGDDFEPDNRDGGCDRAATRHDRQFVHLYAQ